MNLRNVGVFLVAILLTGALMVAAQPATAGPHGTTSLQDIKNALDSDTIPQAEGEMSVQWTNNEGSDTQTSDSSPGSVVVTTDTGFHMTFSNFTDAVNGVSQTASGNQTVSAGDTVVYAVTIENKSNNANAIPFNFKNVFTGDSTTVGNDTFTLEIATKSGQHTASSYDTTTVVHGDASDSVYSMDEAETVTVFGHVTVASGASRGDSIDHDLWATTNAPIGNGVAGTSGDQWQWPEGPVSQDGEDTQARLLHTEVAGPNLVISKTFASLNGHTRPGDTVQFTVTVENTGNDTAFNSAVYDAIPDSTTLVDTGTSGNGDDAYDLTNGTTLTTEHDSSLTGPFSGDGASPASTARLKIGLPDIGPSGQSNDTIRTRFWVTID